MITIIFGLEISSSGSECRGGRRSGDRGVTRISAAGLKASSRRPRSGLSRVRTAAARRRAGELGGSNWLQNGQQMAAHRVLPSCPARLAALSARSGAGQGRIPEERCIASGSGAGKAAAAGPPSGAAASRTERSGSSQLLAARTPPSTSGREACPPRLSLLSPPLSLLATVVALIRAFLFPRLSEIAS